MDYKENRQQKIRNLEKEYEKLAETEFSQREKKMIEILQLNIKNLVLSTTPNEYKRNKQSMQKTLDTIENLYLQYFTF